MPGETSSGRLPTRRRGRIVLVPTTELGRWAVGLALASVVLLSTWSVMGRLGGIPGLAMGIVGGIVALVAIFRRGERALTVFAALLPFLNVVGFVLGSLLLGD